MELTHAQLNRLGPEFMEALERMIPKRMHDGILSYMVFGRPVGGFLTAVLSNDLKGSLAHADSENRANIGVYVNFFYNYAPGGSCGSVEKVQKWMRHSGLEGQTRLLGEFTDEELSEARIAR